MKELASSIFFLVEALEAKTTVYETTTVRVDAEVIPYNVFFCIFVSIVRSGTTGHNFLRHFFSSTV